MEDMEAKMDFSAVVKERFSCKKIDAEKKLSKGLVEKILESGRLAPTAKNLQEQHIYVASSEDALSKIDNVTPCRYGAPVVLVVAFDKGNVYTYPGDERDSGIEDASIVATHLMLSATDLGVNSCWVNRFDPKKLHAELGLPENEEILMLLDLGYAAEGFKPLPNHFSRKPLAETVTEI